MGWQIHLPRACLHCRLSDPSEAIGPSPSPHANRIFFRKTLRQNTPH